MERRSTSTASRARRIRSHSSSRPRTCSSRCSRTTSRPHMLEDAREVQNLTNRWRDAQPALSAEEWLPLPNRALEWPATGRKLLDARKLRHLTAASRRQAAPIRLPITADRAMVSGAASLLLPGTAASPPHAKVKWLDATKPDHTVAREKTAVTGTVRRPARITHAVQARASTVAAATHVRN